MKEPVKPIHKSYRCNTLSKLSVVDSRDDINLHSYKAMDLHQEKYQLITCKNQTKQFNLHSNKFISKQTNIYLLIQSCSLNQNLMEEPHDYSIYKYVCLNTNTNDTYLPTMRPGIYLDNFSNIISSQLINLNDTTILNIYWLKQIETYDIFKYKICYIQARLSTVTSPVAKIVPVNISTKNFNNIFDIKNFYYSDEFNGKKINKLIKVNYNKEETKHISNDLYTTQLVNDFTKIDLNS